MSNMVSFDKFGRTITKRMHPLSKMVLALATIFGVVLMYNLMKRFLSDNEKSTPVSNDSIDNIIVGLEVSPRVTDRELNIIIHAEKDCAFILLFSDESGRVLREEVVVAHHFKIDVSGFVDGVYTIAIIDKVGRQSMAALDFEKRRIARR